MNAGNPFRILSLDGGGVRGIYSAQLLAEVEDALGAPVKSSVDLIAGTSTGAIVAAGAAAGIPMRDVVRLFEVEAPSIFGKRRLFGTFLQSRYRRAALERVVRSCIPDVTMGKIAIPLMITGSDITSGGVHVFKSRYLADLGQPYVRDGNVALADAVLSSCAAPTYFDPATVGDYLIADGGLWANNPSILALTEALSKFKIPIENVRILSIGTGHATTFYSRNKRWGLLTGWGRQKLVAYTLSLQSQASTNMARLILEDGYLRLDPEIGEWELDNTGHLENLKALAARDFAHRSEAVMTNLRRTNQ